MGVCEEVVMESQIWFMEPVIMLLVTGAVELNLGLPLDNGKTEHILAYVQNQEKGSKGIKSLSDTHSQEIEEIKDVTQDLRQKFEKLINVINKVITNYKKIKKTVKEWEERQHMVDNSWRKGTERITY
jgi:hypothetical protein